LLPVFKIGCASYIAFLEVKLPLNAKRRLAMGNKDRRKEKKKPKQPKDKTVKALPLKGKTPILPPQR
jgi:hypothetical protein